MKPGWSEGHRKQDQAELRRQDSEQFLAMLKLSMEQYTAMEVLLHFNDIVRVAAQHRVSYYRAEVIYYEGLGEQTGAEPEQTGQFNIDNSGVEFAGISGLLRAMEWEAKK